MTAAELKAYRQKRLQEFRERNTELTDEERKEKNRIYQQEHRENNAEKHSEYMTKYRAEHAEELRQKRREYKARKRQEAIAAGIIKPQEPKKQEPSTPKKPKPEKKPKKPKLPPEERQIGFRPKLPKKIRKCPKSAMRKSAKPQRAQERMPVEALPPPPPETLRLSVILCESVFGSAHRVVVDRLPLSDNLYRYRFVKDHTLTEYFFSDFAGCMKYVEKARMRMVYCGDCSEQTLSDFFSNCRDI